ncbi:hypothetical protein ACFX2A_013703 [Malus domestica]
MASTIANRITQHRSSVVPSMPKSIPRHLLGAKSGSPLKMIATIESNKVDFAAKVVLGPIPFAAETGSTTGKDKSASVGSYEKSTKPVSGEFTEICALLKSDLFEDMDACAKLVDSIKEVVCPSSFAKHITQHRRTALLAMLQKTEILAAESMLLNQAKTKAAKEMATIMATDAYSFAKKIKMLESELVTLKGSNIFALTSLQLETACQEIVDLKTRFDAIQVKYESVLKEIGCYIPQIQGLECDVSRLRSTAFAMDEELIATCNLVINFKKIIDMIEPQVLELQGMLKV